MRHYISFDVGKQVHNFSKALGNRSKTDSIDVRTIYRMRKIIDEDDIPVPLNDERVDKLTKALSTYRIIKRMRRSLMNHNSENHSDIKFLKERITKEIERLKLLEDEIVRAIIEEIIERDEELNTWYRCYKWCISSSFVHKV